MNQAAPSIAPPDSPSPPTPRCSSRAPAALWPAGSSSAWSRPASPCAPPCATPTTRPRGLTSRPCPPPGRARFGSLPPTCCNPAPSARPWRAASGCLTRRRRSARASRTPSVSWSTRRCWAEGLRLAGESPATGYEWRGFARARCRAELRWRACSCCVCARPAKPKYLRGQSHKGRARPDGPEVTPLRKPAPRQMRIMRRIWSTSAWPRRFTTSAQRASTSDSKLATSWRASAAAGANATDLNSGTSEIEYEIGAGGADAKADQYSRCFGTPRFQSEGYRASVLVPRPRADVRRGWLSGAPTVRPRRREFHRSVARHLARSLA